MTAMAAPARHETPWWLVLVEGISAIILGGLLLVSPGKTAVIAVQVIAIFWLVAGLFQIMSIFVDSTKWGWKLVGGILGIAAGLLILGQPIWGTALLGFSVIIILGVQGLLFGVVGLIQAFQGGGLGAGILGVISIVFGLVLLANPWIAAVSLPWVIGIFMLAGGITAVITAFRLK